MRGLEERTFTWMAQGYSERVRCVHLSGDCRTNAANDRHERYTGRMNQRLFQVCASFVPVLLMGCAEGNVPLGSSSGTSSSSSSSGSGGGDGGIVEENIPEPDGPPKLTIVNGVNDYDAIRLCFLPWPDGGDSPAYPADAKGLAFAGSAVIDLASGVVPQATDAFMYVIAGDLGQTAGKGCAEITAGGLPPEVLVVPLAVIPRTALDAPRSLLLVPYGCLGGPGHDDPSNSVICGKTYSLDSPTPGLLAGGMSRIVEPDVLSLQAAHASAAMQEIDIQVLPGVDMAMGLTIAPGLTLGAIGKMPPFRVLSKKTLGPIGATNILTTPPGSTQPNSMSPLQAALARGGIPEAEFSNGKGFTWVGVGSAPSVKAGAYWHELTWTVVRSDP